LTYIFAKKRIISAAKHGRPMASVKALMVSGQRKTLKSIVVKLVANAEMIQKMTFCEIQ
jgi:hypothetical protein